MATLPGRGQQTRTYHQGWLYVRMLTPTYQRFYVQLKSSEILLFISEPKSTTTNASAIKRFPLKNIEKIEMHESERVRLTPTTFSTISLIYSFPVFDNIKEVRMRATKKAEQEEWFRYLWAVIKRALPDTTSLLPGQIQKLQDTIDHVSNETDYLNPVDLPSSPPPKPPSEVRRASVPTTSAFPKRPPGTKPEHPKWFIATRLSRVDAEEILRRNDEYGNMLMRVRDADDEWTYAVSVKVSNIESEFKHYRVKKGSTVDQFEYVIYLGGKTHPRLTSTQEVMEYFVKESDGSFVPLTGIRPQDTHLYDVVTGTNSILNGEPHYINERPATSPKRPPAMGSRSYFNHQISCPDFRISNELKQRFGQETLPEESGYE